MIPLHAPANTLRLGDPSCILSFLHVFPIRDCSRGLMQPPATSVQPRKDIILKQCIAQAYQERMDSFCGQSTAGGPTRFRFLSQLCPIV